MANPYYSASGNPATGSEGLSALIRAEFLNISAGFDLLPAFSGNGSKAVVVNPGGTALTVTTGTLALAGNFSTTGAFNTVLVQGASVTLTLPVVSGTLATLAGTETLSNKTLVAPALGTPVSGVATNLTGTAAGMTVGNATNATNATTATNQSGGTVSATTLAASSTVSGAGFTARFSASGPIGDVTPSTAVFTTLAASGAVSGAGFTARFSTPGPIGDSSPSTAAFITLAASGAVSGAGFTARFATPGAIGSTVASTGAFTTISASGQITSTVSTGSAPLVVASTTNVANLNASSLSGATFAAPGAIGGGTPSTGAFTTLSATGLVSPSSVAGIKGTTTNDSAQAGSVGEYISSTVLTGSAVLLTSGASADITSISLTAGDWDVWGNIALNIGAGTVFLTVAAWISATSATPPTLPNGGADSSWAGSTSVAFTLLAGFTRILVSTTTTIYLSTNVTWSTAQPGAYGFIGARRVR